MKPSTATPRADLYTRVTERVIADLEKGVRPWLQPWNGGHAVGRITVPCRHNGVPYRGINILLLWGEAIANGYASPLWMTFKQALSLEAHVRKGEHGAMVVFADRFTKKETDADGNDVEREIPVPEGLRGCSTSRRSKACRLTTTLSPRPRPRSCS